MPPSHSCPRPSPPKNRDTFSVAGRLSPGLTDIKNPLIVDDPSAARLANGNLLVRGEKWIQLNQGNEYVQIQGIVRPADIAPDNSIPSSRVADARIAYGGRGAVSNSNVMGWLSKFFNSPIYPM